MKNNKIFFIIIISFGILFGFTDTSFAYEVEGYGQFHKEGERAEYYLDAVPESELEETGFLKNISEKWNFIGNINDKTGDMILSIFNAFVNMGFKFNIIMTKFMLFTFDFTYKFQIFDAFINAISGYIEDISGISNHSISSEKGLYGAFIKFVILFSVVYALFMLIWKRSIFASFGTVIQTTLIIALSIFFFTNYSTILSGANKITNEATTFILSGGSMGDEEELLYEAKANLWEGFVDRPYLFFQFGASDLNDLEGDDNKDRVMNLLYTPKDSEKREEYLKKEYEDFHNYSILNNNVTNRMAFLPVVQMINGITSIPVFLLSFSLIFFQFWFLIIAAIAPFALLIAAIPGQTGVFKRYFIELSLPLFLKIAFSVVTLILMFLSGVVSSVISSVRSLFAGLGNGGLDMMLVTYVAIMLTQLILFLTIFLLRNRIKAIFLSGKDTVSDFREEIANMNNPFKKGFQKTASVAGAAVGASMGGYTGAAIGANIGNEAGKFATGESSFGDVASSAMAGKRTMDYAKLSELADEREQQQMQDNLQRDAKRQKEFETAKGKQLDELSKEDLYNLKNNLSDEELERIETAGKALEEKELEKMDKQERLDELESKPLGDLSDDEYEEMNSLSEELFSVPENDDVKVDESGNEIERKPLEEKSFNELTDEEKYKLFKRNEKEKPKVDIPNDDSSSTNEKTNDTKNDANKEESRKESTESKSPNGDKKRQTSNEELNKKRAQAEIMKNKKVSELSKKDLDSFMDTLSEDKRAYVEEQIKSKPFSETKSMKLKDLMNDSENNQKNESRGEKHQSNSTNDNEQTTQTDDEKWDSMKDIFD